MLSNHPSVLGSGASGATTSAATSASLDLISTTQGAMLYRNATVWVALTPGTAGQLLSTQGAAANPIWVSATGGAGNVSSGAATDNAIVRYDGISGETVQNSAVTIADTTGAMTFANTGSFISLAGTTASTGVGTGALQVAGGIYAGGASYFGGAVSAAGTVTSTVAGGSSAFSASSDGSLYGLTISRGATTNYGGIRFSTAGNEKWFVGMRELSDDYFRVFAGALGADALAINNATGAATFAGAVTGNSTFTSGVLSTTAGGYKLFDAGGYAVNFRPTAARTYVIEGDSSGNDYLTSFTNAGAGKHNLAASGTLSITGAATFAGLVFPQQATTAGAPTYVKGAIYFDTTLNKLRVGGASAWETITSV